MLAALLPEFRGVRRDSPKVRTALERLMDEPRPGGPFLGEPGLISALGAGGPDRCGSGEVRSQGVVTPVRIRLRPHHSSLGFPTVAYSYEPVGRDATRRRWRTWVKEVRYGGYMLQVALAERFDDPVRGGGPELRLTDLDDATGQADQRSARVFRANSASRALADGAEDDVQYALMRRIWSGLKEDTETGGRQRGSAGSLAFPQGVPAYLMTTAEDRSFGVHTVVRSRPEVHRYLRTLALPGSCTSFRHSMNGTPVTVRAEALDAEPIGDSSRAIKITTSDGDSPTYVRWFSIGPYINEVRVGTVGTTDSRAVTQRRFDAFARKAYEAAQDNIP